MKELSLNILDISQNSVKSNASEIKISVIESGSEDKICLTIEDNGCGMSKDFLEKVCDPFVTTRTTRKVGLGIPLLKQSAEDTNGRFEIKSQEGVGTTVYAEFQISHLDRVPIGDMASTIITLIGSNDKIRYIYSHKTDEGEFLFDTDEVKEQISDIPLSTPDILIWISEYLKENLEEIKGGKI